LFANSFRVELKRVLAVFVMFLECQDGSG